MDTTNDDFLASLDLVTTAPGSLKLGLKRPPLETNSHHAIQLQIPGMEEDPWESLRKSAAQSQVAIDGIEVLVKTIASVEDKDIFEELAQEYDENELLKLIHYAKELAPSSHSNVEYISFELPKNNNLLITNVRADRQTRKKLGEYAKKLTPNKEYIKGKGLIRALDLDSKNIVIRPLYFDNIKHDEIRCLFLRDVTANELESYLNKPVSLSGYIIYSADNKLIRLEVDQISIEEE